MVRQRLQQHAKVPVHSPLADYELFDLVGIDVAGKITEVMSRYATGRDLNIYVDAETAPSVAARLGRLQLQHGNRFAPSPLLQEHARTGARFYAN